MQNVLRREVAVCAIILQESVRKRSSVGIQLHSVNEIVGIRHITDAMSLNQLHPGRALVHDLVDENLAIRIDCPAYQMLALRQVETPGQFSMAAPAIEVGFRLAVPCAVHALRLRLQTVTHGIKSHAAYDLPDEAGVTGEIAGAAYQFRAYPGSQVERGITGRGTGNLRPARGAVGGFVGGIDAEE